ncbi:MAG: hypothetical protein H0W09_04480 [Solirubrobacterales bacterium]|nr:hypothetical protein [Solirubrobacterales bacterium]
MVNARTITFKQRRTGAAFKLIRAGGSSGAGGGRHPGRGTKACPDFFDVLHDDRIGKLSLPAGKYRITVMKRPSCERAAKLLAKFLQDYDGKLAGGWRLRLGTASFSKRGDTGFRVKQKVGPDADPQLGGQTPGILCPATFRVRHDDRIGRLKLPKGGYDVWRLNGRSPSCEQTTRLFAKFLERPDGNLPGRWRLKLRSASFVRGGSGEGFRVKQAASR